MTRTDLHETEFTACQGCGLLLFKTANYCSECGRRVRPPRPMRITDMGDGYMVTRSVCPPGPCPKCSKNKLLCRMRHCLDCGGLIKGSKCPRCGKTCPGLKEAPK